MVVCDSDGDVLVLSLAASPGAAVAAQGSGAIVSARTGLLVPARGWMNVEVFHTDRA
jgi:hypothetical protein